MSMMMPPDPTMGMPPGAGPEMMGGGPPGMPLPPGGGGEIPPMDAMSGQPLPSEGGIEGLIAALQGGGGGPLPSDDLGPGGPGGLGQAIGAEPDSPDMADMSPIEHIQHAMKHLMMAMASSDDDEQGVGITKGMGALQAILGGEQKRQKTLAGVGG